MPPIECRASFLKALVFQQASQSLSLLLFQVLPDELPAIFLGGHATAHHNEVLLGEGNDLPLLARDLNEASSVRAAIWRASLSFTQSGPGCCVLGKPYLLR